MGFIRGLWNAITATKNVVTNLLFLLILVVVIVAIFSRETPSVPESGALVIDPTGILVEQKQPIDPFAKFLSDQDQEAETRFRDVLEAIDEGKEDERIKALVLDLDGLLGAPMSMLQEFGRALDSFSESGKPVLAFGRGYNQGQYYIASHADEVLLDRHAFPTLGGVFMTGFGVFPTYFASALEKLSVNIHTFQMGTYKSAVEPYTRDSMSAAARESNQRWLGELWSAYTDGVLANRDVSGEAFERYTNRYDELLETAGGDAVQLAVDQGLVDTLLTPEEFDNKITSIVGSSDNGEFAGIGFRDYLSVVRPPIPVPTPGASQIAVITAKGTILGGEQPSGTIGGETLAQLIEKARENSAVKALVVRIDSPGGSAEASERIRAQLAMTRRAGKPVVVSMSATAASGGYWIASTANKIFAQPSTITGSIGAFIVLPTLENSLERIGVFTDGIGTTELAGSLDPTRPLNPVLERTIRVSLQHTYQHFLEIVAEGRDMTVEAVDEIAQGQVWSGSRALELGLVDAIGNLDDAVASAALLADVTDYEIMHVEKELSPRERLTNQLLNSSSALAYSVIERTGLGAFGLKRLTTEARALVEMSRKPDIYLHCLACKVQP